MTATPAARRTALLRGSFSLTKIVCAISLLTMAPCVAEAGTSYNLTGAWSGTSTYNVNDVVTYNGGTYVNIVATAPVTTTTSVGGQTNLFDQSAVTHGEVVVAANGSVAGIGGFTTSGYVNVAGASTFVTNLTVGIFAPYGTAFYDGNKNFISGSFLSGNGFITGGTPIAVPSGATYVRFWWQDANMGASLGSAIVDTGSTLQSTYTAFGVSTGGSTATTTTPCAAPTDTTHWAVYTAGTSSSASGPWAGKKMFVLGDSIIWTTPMVAGQIASAIGAVPSSQGATAPGIDGFPGRTFSTFTNGQSSTGAFIPVSASVLADVDLMVIALGTNQDSSAGIGLPTDSPSLSGSMSAQMRAMLETILTWKPGMRVIVVGPYQTNRFNYPSGTDGLLGFADPWGSVANAQSLAVLKSINAGMRLVCNLYGIPYVDMYNESGVNFSTSPLWLKDGLHPNATGYSSFYVPYIAAQLNHFSQ